MIRVHIRRGVTDANQDALMGLINRLRSSIIGQPGYLSSETLIRTDRPGEILVVSKWESQFYWTQWFDSRERAAVQAEIDEITQADTEYEFYTYP